MRIGSPRTLLAMRTCLCFGLSPKGIKVALHGERAANNWWLQSWLHDLCGSSQERLFLDVSHMPLVRATGTTAVARFPEDRYSCALAVSFRNWNLACGARGDALFRRPCASSEVPRRPVSCQSSR